MFFLYCPTLLKSHHSHVRSVSLSCADASVLHDPLVRSPLLPSITAIVPKTPGTVDQHLLRQNLQGPRLKDQSRNRTACQHVLF